MTYSFLNEADQVEARNRARSADGIAALILLLMAVWRFGAALMFTAAIKGSSLSSPSATASNAMGASLADAPATPAAPYMGHGLASG